jgi:hypothetical protein
MTLVMAFIGASGAVMGGDMREMTTIGSPDATAALERELFSGSLKTDDDLIRRAEELGVNISIRDDKVKVVERDGVLVGEVTAFEAGVLRSRLLYATAGSYTIVETGEGPPVRKGEGGAGNFVVLGNELAKGIAGRVIRDRWRNGGLDDAREVITRSLEQAAAASPSVSRRFILVETRQKVDLRRVVEEDG